MTAEERQDYNAGLRAHAALSPAQKAELAAWLESGMDRIDWHEVFGRTTCAFRAGVRRGDELHEQREGV